MPVIKGKSVSSGLTDSDLTPSGDLSEAATAILPSRSPRPQRKSRHPTTGEHPKPTLLKSEIFAHAFGNYNANYRHGSPSGARTASPSNNGDDSSYFTAKSIAGGSPSSAPASPQDPKAQVTVVYHPHGANDHRAKKKSKPDTDAKPNKIPSHLRWVPGKPAKAIKDPDYPFALPVRPHPTSTQYTAPLRRVTSTPPPNNERPSSTDSTKRPGSKQDSFSSNSSNSTPSSEEELRLARPLALSELNCFSCDIGTSNDIWGTWAGYSPPRIEPHPMLYSDSTDMESVISSVGRKPEVKAMWRRTNSGVRKSDIPPEDMGGPGTGIMTRTSPVTSPKRKTVAPPESVTSDTTRRPSGSTIVTLPLVSSAAGGQGVQGGVGSLWLTGADCSPTPSATYCSPTPSATYCTSPVQMSPAKSPSPGSTPAKSTSPPGEKAPIKL